MTIRTFNWDANTESKKHMLLNRLSQSQIYLILFIQFPWWKIKFQVRWATNWWKISIITMISIKYFRCTAFSLVFHLVLFAVKLD